MGRPKKEDEIILTPEEIVFKLVLKMLDIRLSVKDTRAVYNIVLLLEKKGHTVELGELLGCTLNLEKEVW